MNGPGDQATQRRVAVVARLSEGSHERALELIERGPPFDPQAMGFEEHTVYLSAGEVVFVFEGEDAARKLADVVDDMVISASFSPWAALLQGPPRLAHALYQWEAR